MFRIIMAQQSDCMPYMIASNKMLIDIAKMKPKEVSALKNGKKKTKYHIFLYHYTVWVFFFFF